MISEKLFIEWALSFPGTEQVPHFERTGFKVKGRRMFATYLAENNTANIFLTPVEQRLFCKMQTSGIFPVPNKWGEKGATTFELSKISKEIILEALLSAYNEVIKPKKKKG
ncbi:MAG TPA: MmcQ/YjbR family DNA-binding protein [Puia sp.]|nr:MmcQ/YjbR family DNA-binding protein [Puia sp.]